MIVMSYLKLVKKRTCEFMKSKEHEELRQMIGAYEDERKKKRKNDTKRTRNKIKGI